MILCSFGGFNVGYFSNDTWSFNTSTRKWSELQCTGHVPTPRRGHVASLVNGVMYVFGGYTADETPLDDLVALQLSSEWFGVLSHAPTLFTCKMQHSQTSPVKPIQSTRSGQTMASDGIRVFILGGISSVGAQVDEITIPYFLTQVRTFFLSFPMDQVWKLRGH